MFGDAPENGGGDLTYGGWRIRLNRFTWRAFIFTMGPFVVLIEKILPGRGIGGRIASGAARSKMLVEALRPQDGGVADRRDLGSLRGRAWGVTIRNDA